MDSYELLNYIHSLCLMENYRKEEITHDFRPCEKVASDLGIGYVFF